MSSFMTPAQGAWQVRAIVNRSNCLNSFRGNSSMKAPFAPGTLWTSSRFLGSAGSDLIGLGDLDGKNSSWDLRDDPAGSQSRKTITGLTKDSTGAVLPNCIVQGFETATDTFVGEVTSDNGGWYRLPTQYTGNHYLVAYKAGSPDVAGTSVNTIAPV